MVAAVLLRLVYSSSARAGLLARDLEQILLAARTRNATHNVTGMLLFADGVFLQLLEGHAPDVHQIFDLIARDRRHQNLVKLLEETITERDFPLWTMGYSVPTPVALERFGESLDRTRRPAISMAALGVNPPLATRLLLSFADRLGFGVLQPA